MPSTAQRGRAPVGPGNVTGRIFADQLRAKQAKDAAASIDIGEVKRQAYTDGLREGVASGFTSGWTSLGELLIATGAISEERLLEIVNSVGDGDEPAGAAR